jgi:WD40 repeat protein
MLRHVTRWHGLATTGAMLLAGALPSPAPEGAKTPPTRLTQQEGVSGAAFSVNGRWLATTEYLIDPHVYIWDLDGACLLRRFPRPNLPARTLAFTPDASRLVVLGEINPFHPAKERALQVFDVATGNRLFELGDAATLYMTMAVSPDGKWLAAIGHGTDFNDKSLHVFDLVWGKTHARVTLGAHFVNHLRFVDDRTIEGVFPGSILTASIDGGPLRAQEAARVDSLANAVVSPDGNVVVSHIARSETLHGEGILTVWGPGGTRVHIHDNRRGTLLHRLDEIPKRQIRSISFSHDGAHVALATFLQPLREHHLDAEYPDDIEPEISVLEVKSGRTRMRLGRSHTDLQLPTRPNHEVNVVFSPDGTTLALFGWDATIRLVRIPQ